MNNFLGDISNENIAVYFNTLAFLFFIVIFSINLIKVRKVYKNLINILIYFIFYLLFIYLFNIGDLSIMFNLESDGKYLFIPIIFFILFFVINLWKVILGTIDIEIDKNDFISGELLGGRAILKLNKNINHGKISVFLRGYTKKRSGKNTTLVVTYESSKILDEKELFIGGGKQYYNFNFLIPYKDNNLLKGIDNPYLSEDQIRKGKELGKKIEKGLNFIGYDASNYDPISFWKICVEFDKKGLNLYNDKKIKITRDVSEETKKRLAEC